MYCKPIPYIKMWEIDYNTGILQRKKENLAGFSRMATCGKELRKSNRTSMQYVSKTYLVVHKGNPYNKGDIIYIVLASNKNAAMKIVMQEILDLLPKEGIHHYFILELGSLLCKKIKSVKLSGPIFQPFLLKNFSDPNIKYWDITFRS